MSTKLPPLLPGGCISPTPPVRYKTSAMDPVHNWTNLWNSAAMAGERFISLRMFHYFKIVTLTHPGPGSNMTTLPTPLPGDQIVMVDDMKEIVELVRQKVNPSLRSLDLSGHKFGRGAHSFLVHAYDGGHGCHGL